MSSVLIPKAAAALLAATVMAGGGAIAWTATHTGADSAKSPSIRRVDGAVDKSINLVPVDGLVDSAAAAPQAAGGQGSASAGANVSGGGGSAGVGANAGTTGAKGGLPASTGGATTGAATTGGTPSGGALPAGNASGGTPIGGSGSGGSGGPAEGTGGGSRGVTVTVPTIPSGVSIYREGSYNLVVPGTPAVSKKLCLSGEIDRCQTVNVPALHGVNVTVSYAANASADAPTFAVFPCQGGLGVTVSGLTPETSVMVKAEGAVLTRTLSTREASQSASFCDA